MNTERAAMMGRLAGLQQERERLKLRIEGNAKHIRQELNTLLTPAEELEILLLDEQWGELKAAWAQLLKVAADIKKLERELV